MCHLSLHPLSNDNVSLSAITSECGLAYVIQGEALTREMFAPPQMVPVLCVGLQVRLTQMGHGRLPLLEKMSSRWIDDESTFSENGQMQNS